MCVSNMLATRHDDNVPIACRRLIAVNVWKQIEDARRGCVLRRLKFQESRHLEAEALDAEA